MEELHNQEDPQSGKTATKKKKKRLARVNMPTSSRVSIQEIKESTQLKVAQEAV